MFFHSKHSQRGEIATTLTLIAVLVMAAGAVIGANITRNQDPRSLAQNSCGLSSPPSITAVTSSGVTCQYTASSVSEGYVCALVDENLPAGNQVTAGQNIPWGGTWNGTTASVPLTFKSGMSINSSHSYTLVVYKFDQGDTCKQTQSYSGSQLANFTPGGTNPPPSNPPPTTPQNQPAQCTNEGGSCVVSPNDCQGSGVQLSSGLGCTGGYCCKPKTSTPTSIPSCTTGIIREADAVNLCGVNNFQKISNTCYRCISSSQCYSNIGSCNNGTNCSSQSNKECRQTTPNCWTCVTKPTATPTPTPRPITGRAECEVQYRGSCMSANACNQLANSTVLSLPRGCTAPNSACCVIQTPTTPTNPLTGPTPPLQSPISQPQSLQQIAGRRGFSLESTSNGYVFFEGQGQQYAVPYMVPLNEQNLFRVL